MPSKKIYRTAPCAKFDIGRIESWLTDMAADGWHLQKRGLLFVFEKGEPQEVRYRLEPKQDFGDIDQKPERSIREVYEACGWEAVTDYGSFFIFRAVDEQARELHTDSLVHAASIRRLIRQNCVLYLLEAYLVISRMLSLAMEPSRWLITYGTFVTVCFAVLLIAAMGIMIHDAVRLIALYRHLKACKPLDHRKPWRRGAIWHRLGSVALVTVYVLFIVMMLSRCTDLMQDSSIHINDYPGDPPFVTIQDLYPEGEYDNSTSFAGYNHYTSYKSSNAPVNIEWREYATVTMPDGTALEGAIIVMYHETKNTEFARELAEEYQRRAYGKNDYQEIPAPDVEAEFIAAYSDMASQNVILQKGNIVVQVGFTIQDEDGYPLEKWVDLMLQMLK